MFPQILIPGDEYLNLNVYTPDPGADGLPVFVSIHGGGGVFGSNADPTHGMAQLARRGIVAVVPNYRLGFEGFLPTEDDTGNRAVLDWLQALEWVQENISSFGGDPANVTVGGYSAGSGATHLLLTLPRASGLFGRALCMSGTAERCIDLEEGEERATEFVGRLGIERTREALRSVALDRLFEVQSDLAPIVPIASDALELFRMNSVARGWLGPMVDGDIIATHPMDALEAGAGAGRGLMIGCTVGEMDALLGILGNTINSQQAELALRQDMGLSSAGASLWLETQKGRTPGQALGAALTARGFRRSALRVARAHSSASAPTYVYEFTWQPATMLGAVHGVDVPFAFDSLGAEEKMSLITGPEPPQSLADDMCGAISRFVTDGDPGWPSYDEETRSVMLFDVPSRVEANPKRDQVVWEVFGSLE
jgi:para-nitrobenzyl esterase